MTKPADVTCTEEWLCEAGYCAYPWQETNVEHEYCSDGSDRVIQFTDCEYYCF